MNSFPKIISINFLIFFLVSFLSLIINAGRLFFPFLGGVSILQAFICTILAFAFFLEKDIEKSRAFFVSVILLYFNGYFLISGTMNAL